MALDVGDGEVVRARPVGPRLAHEQQQRHLQWSAGMKGGVLPISTVTTSRPAGWASPHILHYRTSQPSRHMGWQQWTAPHHTESKLGYNDHLVHQFCGEVEFSLEVESNIGRSLKDTI